ncbi:AAC(3) family N-acetyltransferase [Streptomyces sp. TRM 70361]|uniref:AAC(3) family N-acetyltransferase n=1 Tax=Streptomyces sp. TRM 70361 TaxID=3116553 RepID=UPI002E7AC214|nr:AAC(3) family N-acetyltransferase [Streptomyces sp. TRM 70361]MEE1942896.1 AAC(3) family N-acetyltransferase [Streptomyces sp. TRM 70361]
MTITTRRLAEAVDALLPADGPVMVHSSLRSFGQPVEGGADTVLDVLLAGGRTVLVPSFSGSHCAVWVSEGDGPRPRRNGMVYADPSGGPAGVPYTTDCGLIDADMGALPAALIARRDAHRGDHPINSFAAAGPLAAELIAAQRPDDVYGPLRALAERGGDVLLLGVGLNRMTALHLAEQLAGRRLFVRWARAADGAVVAVEAGGCSEGFPGLAPHLAPHARTASVGASRWTVHPLREALATAAAAIAADPELTRCAEPGCLRCEHAIAGGPL